MQMSTHLGEICWYEGFTSFKYIKDIHHFFRFGVSYDCKHNLPVYKYNNTFEKRKCTSIQNLNESNRYATLLLIYEGLGIKSFNF